MGDLSVTQKKSVFVTGAAGFVGSHLVHQLTVAGYRVIGFDNLTSGKRERLAEPEKGTFELIEGDVRDLSGMRHASRGADYVVHLAEVKIPRYGNSLDTLDVNVRGTENALQVATAEEAVFVLGSTDEVYGKSVGALNEESALVMGSPTSSRWSLGVSKLLAEQLCFAYAEAYGLRAMILRLFGGYGPGQALDWHGGVQSAFMTAALLGDEIPIHGSGLQVRTLTHVADLVSGIILAMESPYASGEIFNIASQDSLSIINLAYLIWRLVGRDTKPRLSFIPYSDFAVRYEDVLERFADTSKAQYLLGYSATTTLSVGLQETIGWQRAAVRSLSV